MTKAAPIIFFFFVLISSSGKAISALPDAPHNADNNFSCADCHTNALPAVDRSAICVTCHDGTFASLAKTHSNDVIHGPQTGPYGAWELECLDCHNAHFHFQLVNIPDLYLVTGTIDSGSIVDNLDGTSTANYSGATIKSGWNPPPHPDNADWGTKSETGRGLILVSATEPSKNYEIVSATNAQVTINGIMDSSLSGASFGVIYGQYINDFVDPDGSGARTPIPVKFYDRSGLNSFADGDATYDGACEVCHQSAFHFRDDGTVNAGATGIGTGRMDHTSEMGKKCTSCHTHASGFWLSNSANCGSCHANWGSHSFHMESDIGPQLACYDCHDTTNYSRFTDNKALAQTIICDTCHSAGGVYNGVDSVGNSIGAKDNWVSGIYNENMELQPGKERWCLGCHDDMPSVILGISASNLAGDDVDYGYYLTGHGKHGNGKGIPCLSCHDTTMTHFDGIARTYKASSDNYQDGYRLKTIGNQPPLDIPRTGGPTTDQFSLCFDCHDSTLYLTADGTGTNFRNDVDDACNTPPPGDNNKHEYHLRSAGVFNNRWDSDWNGGGDSLPSCSACHNVHGPKIKAGATSAPAMIRTGELIGRTDALNLDYLTGTCPDDTLSLTNELATSTGGAMKHYDPPANGSIAVNGVCSMCHPEYEPYWRGPVTTSSNCEECHGHDPGYGGVTGGAGSYASHSTHTENDTDDNRGPLLNCSDCHNTANYPLFADSQNLTNTTVCDDCHSGGGPYDGINDSVIGAKNNWPDGVYTGSDLSTGKERWCVGCHDSGVSVIPTGGRQAPDVAGNNTTYGYYISGHGIEATECGACHDLDMDHNFDNLQTFEYSLNNYRDGYRLKLVNGTDEPMVIPLSGTACYYESTNYNLCYSCHDERTLLGDTRTQGVYDCTTNPYNITNDPTVTEISTFFRNDQALGGDFPVNVHWDHLADIDKTTETFPSDFPVWPINGGRSRASCPTCHNPHGDFHDIDVPTKKMTHGSLDVSYKNDANDYYGYIDVDVNYVPTCTMHCHPGSDKWYRDQPGTKIIGFSIADIDPVPASAAAGYTNSRDVLVTVSYNTGTPAEMMLAEDPTFQSNATGWQPYASQSNYTLSAGDGSKTVYIRLRNSTGSSDIENASIILDTIPPALPNNALTSPNGSEVWNQDTAYDITWSQGDISDLNLKANPLSIDYSTDSGISFPNSIAANQANDGIFSWTVPAIESSTTQVSLTATDKAGNQTFDTSDSNFTIQPAAAPVLSSISVTDNSNIDPGAAEADYTNSHSVDISMTAGNNPTHFMLSENPGFPSANWISFSSPYTFSLSPGEGSKTVYCKVKNMLGDSNTLNDTIIVDTINPTILTTTLTAPNGNADPLLSEFWTQESSQTISWTQNDIDDADNPKTNPITLQYSLNSGSNYSNIAIEEANDGSYTWNPLPSMVSLNARVKLLVTDRAGNQVTDESDNNFFMSPPDKFIITSTLDNNTFGTLRYALNNLETNAVIWFKITSTSNNVAEINLQASQPAITFGGVTINGDSQGKLVGTDNPNGPEVRLKGTGPLSGTSVFTFNAVNGWIESLQISGILNPVISNAANTVVLGSQFGFESDDTGYLTGPLLRNGNGITLSSSSSGAIIGANGVNTNYIACTDDSGMVDAGSNNEIAYNIFGVLPDDITECPNSSALYGDIYLNGSNGSKVLNNTVCGTFEGLRIGTDTSNSEVKGNMFGVRYNGVSWIDCNDPSTAAINFQSNNGTNNVIGGPNIATDDNNLRDSNVIDPSTGPGIRIRQTPSDNSTKIYGNFIGTNPEQTQIFPGGYGIYATESTASRTIIGGFGAQEAGNVIANMTSYGIYINSGAGSIDSIGMNRNSFFNNGDDTGDDAIFLGSGENNSITRPTIFSATATEATVTGVVSGEVVEVYLADFDGTEYGEGKIFAGTATATSGTVTVPLTGVSSNDWLTATRTRVSGSQRESSAFSARYWLP